VIYYLRLVACSASKVGYHLARVSSRFLWRSNHFRCCYTPRWDSAWLDLPIFTDVTPAGRGVRVKNIKVSGRNPGLWIWRWSVFLSANYTVSIWTPFRFSPVQFTFGWIWKHSNNSNVVGYTLKAFSIVFDLWNGYIVWEKFTTVESRSVQCRLNCDSSVNLSNDDLSVSLLISIDSLIQISPS
jgi:hypothetical protein